MNKQQILEWFAMICEGIRAEQNGASTRKTEVDTQTLDSLLELYKEDVLQSFGIIKKGKEYYLSL